MHTTLCSALRLPVAAASPMTAAWLAFASFASAAPLPDYTDENASTLDAREQLRHQQRERVLRERNTPQPDVHLPRTAQILPDYPINEQPCFTITTLRLAGKSAAHFQWALKAADGVCGRCVGSQGIVLVINKIQNAILARGYVTTRVMVQEQDLSKGILTLTLQPGRVGSVCFDTGTSWRGRLWNALPVSSDSVLNLRDIEQGLENFQRLPSVTAEVSIVPGQQECTSDLLVKWKAGRPVRLHLGLDDGGAVSTGRYLGSATLSLDAPLAQNDLFYASIGKSQFQPGPAGNRSHTLNYFFPFGYWAFSAYYSDHVYQHNIPFANRVSRYSGKSDSLQFTLSRLVFRNRSHKTTLNLRAYRKHATNAIDGIDLPGQRRRTASWELGLNQRSYLGSTTMDASIHWRRGTGAFGALRAQEETAGTGSARRGIVLADLTINQPLHQGGQSWRWYTAMRGQWSPNALTPQERMGIAGRYTVRGFDGEQVLSGGSGLLWRNELAWNVAARGHELYLALDYGRVYGPGTQHLVGRQLAGSALGVRGALWRRFSYDLFAGVPLYKPANFVTSRATAGFSLNLEI